MGQTDLDFVSLTEGLDDQRSGQRKVCKTLRDLFSNMVRDHADEVGSHQSCEDCAASIVGGTDCKWLDFNLRLRLGLLGLLRRGLGLLLLRRRGGLGFLAFSEEGEVGG
jgi:hypothetical protein